MSDIDDNLIPEHISPAEGQSIWRDIATAPDGEAVLLYDYGAMLIATKIRGEWHGRYKGEPAPIHPTLWLPLPPFPDGAAV